MNHLNIFAKVFLKRSSILVLLVGLLGGALLQAQPTNPLNAAADPLRVAQYPKTDTFFPGKGPFQHGYWFEKLWAERRTEFWRRRQQDKGAVVFLGDSITQGWKDLATAFPNLKTANRGISGDTTRGVLYRLKDDVIDLDPAAVVLLIGTNDLGLHGDPKDAAENVRAILEELSKAAPRTPVIVCNVMPSDPSKDRPPDRIKALNAQVDEIIKQNPNWIRCDTWSIYANAEGNCTQGEFPDLLHPNSTGYAKWTAALNPVFARLSLPARKAE